MSVSISTEQFPRVEPTFDAVLCRILDDEAHAAYVPAMNYGVVPLAEYAAAAMDYQPQSGDRVVWRRGWKLAPDCRMVLDGVVVERRSGNVLLGVLLSPLVAVVLEHGWPQTPEGWYAGVNRACRAASKADDAEAVERAESASEALAAFEAAEALAAFEAAEAAGGIYAGGTYELVG